jgi:glycosyltransferase involved in cell wall biosynthesis
MPKKTDVFVTVVFVADKYANNIAAKTSKIAKSLKSHYSNYEVVIVDNGVSLLEFNKLQKLLTTTACLRVIQLSKDHDTDTAIFAGVDAAIGDYVCILYGNDPVELVPEFINRAMKTDIVFGVANNLKRQSRIEAVGARMFYWYSKRYLHIEIPNGSTYFISMNRVVANALTRSGRYIRHIRQMAKQAGFKSEDFDYSLPENNRTYTTNNVGTSVARAVDLVSNYSHHPLRFVSYLGIFGSIINIIYAIYVVIINISVKDVAKGWTSLSLQTSLMFLLLFMVMAVLAEYIGRILEESRHEPPYHISRELSSTVSIADETRRNVTK